MARKSAEQQQTAEEKARRKAVVKLASQVNRKLRNVNGTPGMTQAEKEALVDAEPILHFNDLLERTNAKKHRRFRVRQVKGQLVLLTLLCANELGEDVPLRDWFACQELDRLGFIKTGTVKARKERKEAAPKPDPVGRGKRRDYGLTPGQKLTKVWDGQERTCTVMEGGKFMVDGSETIFNSLTAAAKGIRADGKECGGPEFFGLVTY